MSGRFHRAIPAPGVAEVLLLQPRIDRTFLAELAKVAAASVADPSIRVLLLSGRGEAFCAGGDRELLLALARRELRLRDVIEAPCRALLDLPVPVVGALEGPAAGAGLMLALTACDVIVAAEESRYGVNFVELGFAPGFGASELLPWLAGPALAAEMLLTGHLYRGRELRDRGLFADVMPQAQVRSAALGTARRMAAAPRPALAGLKAGLVAPRRERFLRALEPEQSAQDASLGADALARLVERLEEELTP